MFLKILQHCIIFLWKLIFFHDSFFFSREPANFLSCEVWWSFCATIYLMLRLFNQSFPNSDWPKLNFSGDPPEQGSKTSLGKVHQQKQKQGKSRKLQLVTFTTLYTKGSYKCFLVNFFEMCQSWQTFEGKNFILTQ